MSEHREWNTRIVWHDESLTALMNEHNATVRAYRDAMAERERLGKANDKACDRIAELERDRDNAVKNAMDCLPDAPWKDKTATEAVWLLSLAVTANEMDWAEYNFERGSGPDPNKALESRPVLTWGECEAKVDDISGTGGLEVWERYERFRDWLLPQLPTERAEMPSAEELSAQMKDWLTNSDGRMRLANKLLDYLRPWLHEPTGWELDVTAEEIHDTCTTRLDGYQAVLDLCRSRIRPAFECKECAKKDTRIEMYDRQQNRMANTIERQRSALERAASAAKSALEGE